MILTIKACTRGFVHRVVKVRVRENLSCNRLYLSLRLSNSISYYVTWTRENVQLEIAKNLSVKMHKGLIINFNLEGSICVYHSLQRFMRVEKHIYGKNRGEEERYYIYYTKNRKTENKNKKSEGAVCGDILLFTGM